MLVEAQVTINAANAAITDTENAAETIGGIEKVEVLEKPVDGLVGLRWREIRMQFGKSSLSVAVTIVLSGLALFGCGQSVKQHPAEPANTSVQQTSPRDTPPNDQALLVGATQFKYTVGDEAGNALAYGVLIIPWPIKDGESFRGTWQARPVLLPVTDKPADPPKIGPQLGGGELAGSRNGNTLRLSLNPHMNDNNVTLIGDISGDEFRGTWEWSTFTGVANNGQFAAKRGD